jgi:hypothetical protein
MVEDRPGEAYRILSALLAESVNLLAFRAVPMDTDHTQLVLYPEDVDFLSEAADKLRLTIGAKEKALLISGDDRLGALADVHAQLYDAGINVYSSNGVTDGRGGYGYVLHVKQADFEDAARALGV